MRRWSGLILGFLLLWAPTTDSTAANTTTKAKSVAKKAVPGKSSSRRLKASAKTKARTGAAAASLASSAKLGKEIGLSKAQSESDLQKEVVFARNVLATNPNNQDARNHLAGVAIAAANMLLAAEAVGNTAKASRLDRFLKKELADVGSRIKKRGGDGETGANQALGYFYANGFLVSPSREKSCAEYKAAASSHAAAAWHWGQCQLESQPAAAWLQIERAGSMGHAIAQEWLGRRCLGEFGAETKDSACARDWLGRSASQGRPKAQTLLAYLFNTGQGGAVDTARALRLYKLAAEQGDMDAQNNVGEVFETGRGVEKNLAEAIQWYEKAAERGLGVAQFNAGRLWAMGVSGRSDPARARAWLVQAEAKGVAQARQVLDWLDGEAVRADARPAIEAVSGESRSR